MEKKYNTFLCMFELQDFYTVQDRLINTLTTFMFKMDYLRVDLEVEYDNITLIKQEFDQKLTKENINWFELGYNQKLPTPKEKEILLILTVENTINKNFMKPKISYQFIFNKDLTTDLIDQEVEKAEKEDRYINYVEEIENL